MFSCCDKKVSENDITFQDFHYLCTQIPFCSRRVEAFPCLSWGGFAETRTWEGRYHDIIKGVCKRLVFDV